MNRSSMLLVAAPLVLLTGCMNLFSPFDHPSGDAQLLSAARAALDRGDFSTAIQDYQQLSGAYADIANSEGAYSVIDQFGAGMGAFALAFGSGGNVNPGKAMTSIANSIGSNASAATRLALFQAFQKALLITDNTQLRGLVRLLTTFSLVGDILAEGAANPSHLLPSDIVANPAGCTATGGTPGCLTSTACAAGNAVVTNGAASIPTPLNQDTEAQISAGATLNLLQAAIDQISAAITEIQPSGSFSGSIGGFTGASGIGDAFIAAGDTPASGQGFNCYRYTLLTQGFGTY